jgi:hypothetical protein
MHIKGCSYTFVVFILLSVMLSLYQMESPTVQKQSVRFPSLPLTNFELNASSVGCLRLRDSLLFQKSGSSVIDGASRRMEDL